MRKPAWLPKETWQRLEALLAASGKIGQEEEALRELIKAGLDLFEKLSSLLGQSRLDADDLVAFVVSREHLKSATDALVRAGVYPNPSPPKRPPREEEESPF